MKTYTLKQIRKAMDPEKDVIMIEEKYVYIFDIMQDGEDSRKLKMLFKKAGKRYVDININELIPRLAKKLAPHVNVETFLKERMEHHSTATEIMELKERLEKPQTKITEAPRCYSLMIGGKRGRPFEFNLVG